MSRHSTLTNSYASNSGVGTMCNMVMGMRIYVNRRFTGKRTNVVGGRMEKLQNSNRASLQCGQYSAVLDVW